MLWNWKQNSTTRLLIFKLYCLRRMVVKWLIENGSSSQQQRNCFISYECLWWHVDTSSVNQGSVGNILHKSIFGSTLISNTSSYQQTDGLILSHVSSIINLFKMMSIYIWLSLTICLCVLYIHSYFSFYFCVHWHAHYYLIVLYCLSCSFTCLLYVQLSYLYNCYPFPVSCYLQVLWACSFGEMWFLMKPCPTPLTLLSEVPLLSTYDGVISQ